MVDRARIKETNEEVSAWDLYRRVSNGVAPNIFYRQTNYICLFCNGVMKPRAIKPDMKKSPYFRIEGGHDRDCSFGKYERLKKEYKKGNKQESILINGKFPCPYPDILDLPELIKVSDRGKNIASNISVKSLQLLVEHYIIFSNSKDRSLQLYVPQVKVKSYQEVFQRIYYRENYHFDTPRIYFGELLYSKKEINDRIIRLYFTEGIWGNKKPKETMFIEIDISSWESYQKRNLIDRIKHNFEKKRDRSPAFGYSFSDNKLQKIVLNLD